VTAAAAVACTGKPRNDGPVDGSHRWRAVDLDYLLNNEANILTETVVRETFDRWAEVTGGAFRYAGRGVPGLQKDGRNTVSFLLRWPKSLPMREVAYCRTWYDDEGYVVEGDIAFNMQAVRFTTLRTRTPDAYFIEGVLSHEIGHLLGLPHSGRPDSVMKPRSAADESYFKGAIDDETVRRYCQSYHAFSGATAACGAVMGGDSEERRQAKSSVAPGP
jgi:hypothetical protein